MVAWFAHHEWYAATPAARGPVVSAVTFERKTARPLKTRLHDAVVSAKRSARSDLVATHLLKTAHGLTGSAVLLGRSGC